MDEELRARAEKLHEAFQLKADTELLTRGAPQPEVSAEAAACLKHFNLAWHIIPSNDVVPFDDAYVARFYPMAARDFTHPREHAPSYRDALAAGHAKHQGRILAIETTRKPHYLPGNRQFYGTPYGFDASADPFAVYMGRAAMTNATRYAHNYLSLREFVRIVNEDWRGRKLLPPGYRLTVCPPAVFNLIGTIFHPEWSETETLELGFYRDQQGNATCYAVGCNAPGDYSYISEVELETDWTLAGFRLALVPE
jgi:hypothetical protein